MTFPPETHQDYCDYFQWMAQNAKPPNPKWRIGLKASQLWKDYCEKDNLSGNGKVLISIVKILMPVRHSGSVLLDLWGQILRDVARLPVHEQKEVWLEIFNIVLQRKVAVFSHVLAGKCRQNGRFASDFARKSGSSCLTLRCNNRESRRKYN